jgi:chromosome segregation ATPase
MGVESSRREVQEEGEDETDTLVPAQEFVALEQRCSTALRAKEDALVVARLVERAVWGGALASEQQLGQIELEASQAREDALQRALTQQESEMQSLECQLADAMSREAELRSSSKSLSERLELAREDAHSSKQSIAQRDSLLSSLRSELEQNKQEVKQLCSRASYAEERVADLSAQLIESQQQAQRTADNLQQQLDSSKQREDDLSTKLREATARAEKLEREYPALRDADTNSVAVELSRETSAPKQPSSQRQSNDENAVL